MRAQNSEAQEIILPNGAEIVVDILLSEGVSYVFGNPGTTELMLIDAVAKHPQIQYVLGLQEATVVGMADGYARATHRPAFVNLHAAAGLGNSLGALSNASYMNVPLVVTAGQQDHRHIIDDPWLTGDLVTMTKPLCKWAHEVRNIDELGTILRRAFKDANTYPKGPVFVALPQNFMQAETTTFVPAKSIINTSSRAGDLQRLVTILNECEAHNIVIIAGDEISQSRAVSEVVQLAEILGADVFGSPLHDSVVFPTVHPLWKGVLKPVAADINPILSSYQKVFLLGARGFMTYTYTPVIPIPKEIDLLHLSADPKPLAMTFATSWASVGDIKTSIQAILPDLRPRNPESVKIKLNTRIKEKKEIAQKRKDQLTTRLGKKPPPPEIAAYALCEALPENALVVDECPATLWPVREHIRISTPDQYHFSKGGGLGWAMPCAIGVCLANDRKRTFCIIGDGAAMYSPQALWTAAHFQLPITYLVFSNCEYGVLKNYLRKIKNVEKFVGLDITHPRVNYQNLAMSMGVQSTFLDNAEKIAQALDWSTQDLAHQPSLIEIKIATTGEEQQ